MTELNASNQIEPTSLATAITSAISGDPTLVLDTVLTGYVSAPGTVADTDTILEAFGKIGAGGGGAVSSVFSRTGAVVAQSGDYDASEVTNAFDKTADDTDDITVGATNKFATQAEKDKLGFITVTQNVDLDTMETDIANKVTANGAITGDTKTKITYDAKGLVTAGADATTTDIGEGTNLYFTEARTLGTDLAGFSSAPGTITSADTILSAFNKLDGNVSALEGSVILKGSWDASTGTFPGAGVAQAGWSYIVSVPGTVDAVSFAVNDRIIAITDNASTTTYTGNWFKADYTDQVLSVFGRTGTVTAQSGDYSAVSETLTNKTVNLANNTLSGTTAEFNTALSDNDFATLAGTETLTNKTMSFANNTFSATSSQLATALSDETGSGSAVFANSPTLGDIGVNTAPSATTSVNINASTTAKSSARLTKGVAPTTPVAGDIWTDTSTVMPRFAPVASSSVKLVGTLFNQTATGTSGLIASIATDFPLESTGVGTLTIPANFLSVGSTIRIRGFGYTSATANVKPAFKVKVNGTTVATATNTQNLTTGGLNTGLKITSDIVVRTIGGSGTAYAQLELQYGVETVPAPMSNNSTTFTLDTTIANTISVTVQATDQINRLTASLGALTLEVV
jgi:hypothetical protein